MILNRLTTLAIAFFLGAPCAAPAIASGAPRQAPPPGYGQQGAWEAAHGPYFGARRQGFQAGMEGALKDFGNHRRPDPENRDQFRHPPVPAELRDAYRDGFRRGYHVTISELMGGDGHGDQYWGQGPVGETRLRGFQDGMEGALHDFDNHRRPDPANRDEFRHPHVPFQLQEAYRDGFRRGYRIAMTGLMGLPLDRQ